MSFTLGKKLGMTRLFDKNGNHVPATLIQFGPCRVTQVKTKDTDGYEAVQVGFGLTKDKSLSKPELGHLRKSGSDPLRFLCEFRVKDASSYKLGDVLPADRFKEGQMVTVSGVSKGRGFAGVIKRHGFSSPNASHGTHEYHRHPGAVGAHTDPGRLWKGLRLPGHMGAARVTVKNLDIIKVDPEQNLMLVRGAVPGARNSLVEIVLNP
ncbi:MAG: 50S ribosomal protein L3 [Candidatus Zixiibacteriota bacterium]|nr:MAG: 50S ribosomal protein L3 [candidate division Zixibacteria bacterium]